MWAGNREGNCRCESPAKHVRRSCTVSFLVDRDASQNQKHREAVHLGLVPAWSALQRSRSKKAPANPAARGGELLTT